MTDKNDDHQNDFDDERFEEIYSYAEKIWKSVLEATQPYRKEMADKYEYTHITPDQWAAMLIGHAGSEYSPEEQEHIIKFAHNIGEHEIERLEQDMNQARIAMETLKKSKAEIMRSLMRIYRDPLKPKKDQ